MLFETCPPVGGLKLEACRNNNAVTISTIGYCHDILSPQPLHLPFCIIKLTTGISSYHFNTFLQCGQYDLFFIMSSLIYNLFIITFKKLPVTRPNKKPFTKKN